MLEEVEDTDEPNGTTISIKITNDRIKVAERAKFVELLSTHYALRDILSSPKRNVMLVFNDLKRSTQRTTKIEFKPPDGEKVVDKEVLMPGYDDRVKIVIYESYQQLSSPRNNPFGLAGILIKTRSAILDNQLFKFDNDPAALYFFGEAVCLGLEERLRHGETGLIDPNRGGLEWRHEYCQVLAQTIEEILEPLVLEKRKSLEKKPEREVGENI